MEDKLGKEHINEMYLYHGTKFTDPTVIYMDQQESFNINFSSDSNLFGRGIYFAEESSYSHNYSYDIPNKDNNKIILLVRVLLGDIQP